MYMYNVCIYIYIYMCVCVCACVCVVPAPEIYLGIYIYIYIMCVCVCAHVIYVSKICINSIIDQNPPVQPFPQPWPAVPDATRDKVQEGSATLWDVP